MKNPAGKGRIAAALPCVSYPGLAAVAALLTALLVPAVGHAGAGGGSGVYGRVLRGPTRPVCEEARACTAPAPGYVLRFRRGTRSYETTAGKDAEFRRALPPGLYRVSPGYRYAIGRGLSPQSVRVPAGRYVRFTFLVDTGIR